MSSDVNEVCRRLSDAGVAHTVTETGHEVLWRDAAGVQWAFFGKLYAGRESRLCAYGIDPARAVAASMGLCGIGGADGD